MKSQIMLSYPSSQKTSKKYFFLYCHSNDNHKSLELNLCSCSNSTHLLFHELVFFCFFFCLYNRHDKLILQIDSCLDGTILRRLCRGLALVSRRILILVHELRRRHGKWYKFDFVFYCQLPIFLFRLIQAILEGC